MKSYYLLVLLSIFTLQGCSTLSYYSHNISGHLSLMSKREPVDELLENCANDKSLCDRLQLAMRIRNFASERLHLPNNGSYRSYVALDQPFVTWAVFAAPEFSLQSRQWCFPVAGCVPYRGYFSRQKAEDFAAPMMQEGLDVHVGGVTAYSTLGWFDDPLLSTMLRRGEITTAGLIFHELAHQQVYIKDDSAFNEAFATAVQQAGVRIWLGQHGTLEQLRSYEQNLKSTNDFFDLVETTRNELQAHYQTGENPDELRAGKQAIIARMRERYREIRRGWNGFSGFDWWFDQPINNARLASVALYHKQVPDFLRLFELCGDSFERFYQSVESLARVDAKMRNEHLRNMKICA